MILCDAGPLISLIDVGDHEHLRCIEAAEKIPRPLVTTWPCLAEAMYLLGKYGGFKAQDELWTFMETGALIVYEISNEERIRMRKLMKQYRDTPMDLADASLVTAAEALNVSQIFTLDKHFHAYRIHDNKPFKVIP